MLTNDFEGNKKISHGCLIRIQSVYPTLKKAEKKAADFLLSDPETLVLSSVVKAAELAGCSEATFTRLAKKLGYSGFPELKSVLLKKADEQIQTMYGNFSRDDSLIDIATKVFQTSIQNINDTLSLLDTVNYKQAFYIMLNAKKCVFIGAGDAYSVAHSAYLKFYRMGMHVSCHEDYDLQLIDVSKLQKNDVLFIISYSGRTKSILSLMKSAKDMGARIITISNYPLSPIGKLSDAVLQTAAFTSASNSSAEIITKRISELCIIESLYINMLIHLSQDELYRMRLTEEILSINKVN